MGQTSSSSVTFGKGLTAASPGSAEARRSSRAESDTPFAITRKYGKTRCYTRDPDGALMKASVAKAPRRLARKKN